MRVTAIIAAAGRGSRVGAGQPKQLLALGGRTMLERSVEAFLTHPGVDEVVVSLPPELVDPPPEFLRRTSRPLRIVAGGVRRQDSVANAFAAAAPDSEVVVIHDAARPFVTADLITRTIAAAVECGAAVAAVASSDTVKRVSAAGSPAEALHHGDSPAPAARYVLETLARETIFLAQTPQAFRRDVLRDALALGEHATDEAALAERAGHRVRIVEGDAANMKITTGEDLTRAQLIASRDGGATFRTGTGYDLHRLVAGRPLLIGGVTIPFEKGALGHSDADVVCHAVTDAVLGAAGLGDIGRHFPDDDPQWKDASSVELLARVAAMVEAAGFEIRNVDATVILERPKIKGHIEAMRAKLAASLGIDISRVSVKGKTNEGVDAVGRGEAIAAHAVALVSSRIRAASRSGTESRIPDPDSQE